MYRRFIRHFSQIAAPLLEISKINMKHPKTKFGDKWTKQCQDSFEELKKVLSTAPLLGYADLTLPFVVETDASAHGLGAVLSQNQNGRVVVIAYASRSLRPNERTAKNMSSLKLLALKWSVTEKFRHYLLGNKFTVITDNNPLKYLSTAKLGAYEQKWASQLVEFDFEIKYRPGKQNVNADVLSRLPTDILCECIQGTIIPQEIKLAQNTVIFIESSDVSFVNTFPTYSMEELAEMQSKDKSISVCKVFVETKTVLKAK